ncbi:MAG: hypothetical protein Kow00129_04410 [Thermoleophilia bacterium]
MERIIGNLDKVKLKLDEAFFYLDEIEDLVEEDDLDPEEGSRVAAAGERLREELAALNSRVTELQQILELLQKGEGPWVEGPVVEGGAEEEA